MILNFRRINICFAVHLYSCRVKSNFVSHLDEYNLMKYHMVGLYIYSHLSTQSFLLGEEG